MPEWMQGLTMSQFVLLLIGFVLATAAAVNQIGAAIERVRSLRQAAKAPDNAQDDRLTKLEERQDRMDDWKKHVDAALVRDLKRFESLDAGERVTQRALLALLDHGIDGNNREQMQHAKEELQKHLINR